MHKRVVFVVDDDKLDIRVERMAVVIERQILSPTDSDGLDRFPKHLGNNPSEPIFKVTQDRLGKNNPRKPFALLQDIDEESRDLVR